jgi:NADH-quinone oxidoreductase subunit M
MSFPYLSVIILSPLVGALILLLIPKERKQTIQLISGLTAVVSLALSIVIFIQYDRVASGYQFMESVTWIKSLGISYRLGADGISIPMLLLTGIIFLTSVLVSSISIKKRHKEFFVSLLLLAGGTFGAFASIDLFFFFFFYELAVIPMFLLIGVWGSGDKLYGALKLTLHKIGGSALVLAGIIALYVVSGQNTFDLTVLSRIAYSVETQKMIFPMLCFGFGVLAILWPLHTWAPIGHSAAPTAASMFLAGVSMKLGAYGILRIAIGTMPEGAKFWMPVVVVLCSINIVQGALVAVAQRDLKFLIGFSSVSHMGIVILGFFTMNTVGVNGAVFEMFSHGVMTGLLFALVGAIYDRAHTRYIDELGGIGIKMPAVAALFGLGGFASAGLPGTSGFVAEFLVFAGAYRLMKLLPVLAIIASAVTALYILRAVRRVFFNELNPKFEELGNAHPLEFTAFGILAASLILFGFLPSLLTNLINLSVVPLISQIGGVIW